LRLVATTRRIFTIASIAVLTFSLMLPAGAVVPAWTTIIQGVGEGTDRGVPYGIVAQGDVTFVLIGTNSPTTHEGACRVVRLDATGALVWSRVVASGTSLDCRGGMAADESGIYVSFNAIGAVDGLPGSEEDANTYSTYLRKLRFDASVIWTRSFSSGDDEISQSIAAAAGHVVIGGYRSFPIEPPVSLVQGAFVRSYDVDGNVQWTRFPYPDLAIEDVNAVAIDGSGTYAAIGVPYGGTTPTFHRFGPDGSPGWITTTNLGFDNAEVTGMGSTGGRIIAVGYTDGAFPGKQSAGGNDAFVATLDPVTGAWGWVRQFGSAGEDIGTGLDLGPAGIYVSGYTNGSLPRFDNVGRDDAFVRSYTTSGKRRWTRQFGTRRSDIARDLAADAEGVTSVGTTDGNLGTEHVEDLAVFVRRFVPA
jgi:hypothetical protein